MHPIVEKLARGETVILDGGTGTELERRGAPMSDAAWCALATLSHGDLLRTIHEDYIRAGAEVIIANTFASSRTMLGAAGRGDQVAEINSRAVKLAREARERAAGERAVAVAGSISHMMPVVVGSDCHDIEAAPAAAEARDNFREMADLLADAGVDLIVMEMMSDPVFAVPAVEAATATGLPVWVGMSCRMRRDGMLASWSRQDIPFADAAREIVAAGGTVAGVMHSEVGDTTAALEVLRSVWDGPTMVYPESGYFEMPHWQFVDVIPPDAFARQCAAWVADGVQAVGGCCGIGAEHIARLAERLGRPPGAPEAARERF